jgi:nucleoside-diphosphate-sugar epimerase
MRILLLGGHGHLGPHVVAALEDDYDLRITDVVPIDSDHETMAVDVADLDQVRAAARGTDAIVNCSVVRADRRGAFDVNARGTFNALTAGAELGHERFINTGPRFTILGPAYLDYDFDLREEVPPHAGTGLYALTKSLGQEVCRIFADNHPIHVLTMIVSGFLPPQQGPGWSGDVNPFAVTFADAGRAVRCALEADLSRLPSRCESFFVSVDMPHGQIRNGKARRLLGWEPQSSLEAYWREAR